MARPYALLRAGFPYIKTIGRAGVTHPPADLNFGKEGRIFVICHTFKYTIRIINLDDEDLGTFGTLALNFPIVEDGEFMSPVQLVVDSDEHIYISDEACHRISIMSNDGKFLGKWGQHGSGDGQLDRPSGIAMDANENLLVVDSNNHRVQKFTKDGRYLGKWGQEGTGNGDFNMPWGIDIDEEGYVYVCDWRNDRIQKFSEDGEFLFEFGRSGSHRGEFRRPSGIAVDSDGDIYVADRGNNRIQLFDPEGNYVQQFLGDATLTNAGVRRILTGSKRHLRIRLMANRENEKYFDRPRSVRVNNEGEMFVPDYEHFRVQVYKKESYRLSEEDLEPPLKSEVISTN
jgi:DNA-binding beta-propeller fold protein YncE